MSRIPTLTTQRLTLRPFSEQDADSLFRILSEEGVLRYFPNTEPPPIERVGRFIAAQLDHWEQHGYGWWAVEPRLSGELIGWNGLQYLPETDEIEVGYLLAKDWWGKGLAAEGARTALEWGFENFDLYEVVGIVHPENQASMRVLEKIGMSFTREAEYFGMRVRRYCVLAPGAQNS